MITTIIFDLGKVLIDFDHSRAAQRISNFCDKTPEEIFDIFFASEVTMLFEAGKISPQDFFKKVKEMLNLKLDYDSFVAIWNDIFFLSSKNRAVYSLANSLRSRYTVVLVSNINILHYEYLKKYFPVFDVFHSVFTSFELQVVKPDQEIYRLTLEKLNVPAQDVFYTDDRAELVDSARKMGIKSFVFTDVEQLKRDLLESGVTLE